MGTSVTFALVCLGLAFVYFSCPTRDPVTIVDQDGSSIRFNISGSQEVLDLTKCGGQGRFATRVIFDDQTFCKVAGTIEIPYWEIECFKEAKEMMDRNKMSFQDIACMNGICQASLYVPNAKGLALKKIQLWVIDGKVPSIEMCATTKSTAELDQMTCTGSPDENKQYTKIPCRLYPGEKKCVSHVRDLLTGTVEEVESDPNGESRSIMTIVNMPIRDTKVVLDACMNANADTLQDVDFTNPLKIVEYGCAWAFDMNQGKIS
jgi:hypothetical protein